MGLQMALMSDSISLICVHNDETQGEMLFVYNLSGVYTETVDGVIVDSDGEDTSNNTLCIVPYDVDCTEDYIKPKAWEALDNTSKAKYYTFREGDVIVINNMPYDCTTIEEIKAKYDDCYTIQAVRNFNKIMRHFELVCK